ncbi:MAG: ATP-binding protein [Nitrospira sp.]|nr:ATP-binding protein [Nitrospira sp.]
MAETKSEHNFRFAISLSVLNHLGRNLYRNFITILGEAISNAWDADARNVWINIDRRNSSFCILDDGKGMTADDFQSKLLKIGYSKRSGGNTTTQSGRPYIGAKGIGKLALLSCARRISIFSKVNGGDYVGGVIDNSELDQAITDDLVPEEYPLEELNFDLISKMENEHEQGTIIVFEDTKEQLRNSIPYLKKLLALSFRFTLLDADFSIFVNGDKVTFSDLKELIESTEFLWLINEHSDEYVSECKKLKSASIPLITSLDVKGFLATVEKPKDLKITGTDERATVDLFVNGRLREKNILRHIPTQRIIESYIYGQLHFDEMDRGGADPFTSSREGIVENDANFQSLLEYLKRDALPQILDQWDELRLRRGQEGDDENTRKSKKERKARALYSAAREEYQPEDEAPEKEQVEKWLDALRSDAEFNLSSYVDCFLSENLIRKFISKHGIPLTKSAPDEINKWKEREANRKTAANINFDIRQGNDDLSYLDMDTLALTAEGSKAQGKIQPLWNDAIVYKPMRNVVGHTGLLTQTAKDLLRVIHENIKARVKALVAGKKNSSVP